MKPFPVSVDPDIVSGEPCFAGTRVMIRTLIDHLIGNYSVDEYLEQYPSVEREQVEAFLETATTLMIQVAHENLARRIAAEETENSLAGT